MARYLELKAKLEAEGLFAASRKRALPFMPRRIAIVTSEAGAVIHDFCRVVTRRFPNVEIRLYPSLVQGAGAAQSLMAGIRHFNGCAGWRADVLVVARGGGSFEDLFCFNDEALVRELAASSIPTISAVGHETDFTLCDFAADVRAGTPSIAAELAVPCLDDIRATVRAFSSRLSSSLRGKGEWFAQRLDGLSASLGAALSAAGTRASARLERLSSALFPALRRSLAQAEAAVERAGARLSLLSPYGVLGRGYAIVTGPDGAVVRSAAALSPGDEVNVMVGDGAFAARVSPKNAG